MQILKDPIFVIKQESDKSYIFYNSIRHFACRISKLDLVIFNLIYTYRSFEIIKKNIANPYINYVQKIYNAVVESGVLSSEPINIHDDKTSIYPSSYYLHLTYKCNLNCIYCYNKDIRTNFEEIELDKWELIIDKISPFARRIILTGGEPFLSNKLPHVIEYIKSLNTSVDIEIISNCMTDFEYYPYTELVFKI